MSLNRGDVYWVNLDPTVGSEIKEKRPCVLIAATPINDARRTIVVIPLSLSAKPHPPITIEVTSIGKNAVAVCDQIRAVDKRRLAGKAGSLNLKDMKSIESGLKQILYL